MRDILTVVLMRAEAIADQSGYRRDSYSWNRIRALAERHMRDVAVDVLSWQETELRSLLKTWDEEHAGR